VLRLCGPATGENRTVGSQDRTVGKKRTKKSFLQLRLQIGANSHEIGEKNQTNPRQPQAGPEPQKREPTAAKAKTNEQASTEASAPAARNRAGEAATHGSDRREVGALEL